MSRLSTKHVVLGLMIDRSAYGYALQQQISERLGFLSLADSAVYKVLQRLEEDGWVEEVGHGSVRSSGGRQPRVLYRATPEGVEHFRRWMASPCARAIVRDELHAKLALSGPSDLPQLLETVEAQAQACLIELASLGRPSLVPDAADVSWAAAARMMTDDFKARSLEMVVDWLNAVAELIEQRIAQSGQSPSG